MREDTEQCWPKASRSLRRRKASRCQLEMKKWTSSCVARAGSSTTLLWTLMMLLLIGQTSGEASNPGPQSICLDDLVQAGRSPMDGLGAFCTEGDHYWQEECYSEKSKGLGCMSGLFPTWAEAVEEPIWAGVAGHTSYQSHLWHRQVRNLVAPPVTPQHVEGGSDRDGGHAEGRSQELAAKGLGTITPLVDTKARHDTPEPAEEHGKTKKRREHRSDGLEIVTYNGSCWATIKDFVQRTTAHVVCSQELKLDGENLLQAEDWCSRNGWKPFITPCRRSPKGECTAGVASS